MTSDNQFSVLAIPNHLEFYLNDKQGCKQEIKIYNVQDFAIGFKILCTSVDNYNVIPPCGTIRSGCLMTIKIELKNHDFDRKKDVFKINTYSKKDNKCIGEKEIVARIFPEKPLDVDDSGNKDQMKTNQSSESSNSNNKSGDKHSKTATLTLDNAQSLIILDAGKFVMYIILIFLFGLITGMMISVPSTQEIKLD